jgi:anti-sigma regulatory factor (Ser/Thr protein kinase)
VRELSLHILDVLQNALEAGASRIDVSVEEDLKQDRFLIEIVDNGRGMNKEQAENVLDPFFTTRQTRHVGLGLPLFQDAARRCDGDLTVRSEPGKGTRVYASFTHSHIDRAPLGDMPGALLAVLLSGHPVDLSYRHRVDAREFRFDSAEIRRELGDVSLTHPKVRGWFSRFLQEEETALLAEGQQHG